MDIRTCAPLDNGMLGRAIPVQFNGAAKGGLTCPAWMTCRDENGDLIELVAKVSVNCTRAVTSLAAEAVAAMLAEDLKLPIPQSYVVRLCPKWLEKFGDPAWVALALRSSPAAFGLRAVGPGYQNWHVGSRLNKRTVQVAAEILVFDVLVGNSDRRDDNPNCLVRGDDIRIIDHELTFPDDRLRAGWRPVWSTRGLETLEIPGAHIYRRNIDTRKIDWDAIRTRWRNLSDEKLFGYAVQIPPEWAATVPLVNRAVAWIKDVRDHIDDCIVEIKRTLSRPLGSDPLIQQCSEGRSQRTFDASPPTFLARKRSQFGTISVTGARPHDGLRDLGRTHNSRRLKYSPAK